MRIFIITVLFCNVTLQLSAQAIINSVSTHAGPVGSTVTLSGLFNPAPASNTVYVGFAKANVTAVTTSSLSFTVPYGSFYDRISVTENNFASYAVLPFITTFSGGNGINANTFAGRTSFTVGTTPLGIAVGDLEGDGKPDILSINNGSQTVSILKNTSTSGTVSFAAKTDLVSGTSPQRIALGDLDNDGKLDLIVANSGAPNQFLLVNRNTSTGGVISFAGLQQFPIGNFVKGIALGDVDDDGKTDVAVINHDDKTVSVLRNSSTPGSISFLPKVDFSTGAFSPFGLVLRDLEGDGNVEMIVSSYMTTGSPTGNIAIFRNTTMSGVMSFAPRLDIPAEDGTFGITVGNLDDDVKTDLIATNNGGVISVYKNQSIANSLSFAARVNYNAGTGTQAVCINDFDGDGKPDIAVSNYSSPNISVFKNTSTPGNISLQASQSFASANNVSSISSGDIDSDGKADLITGDESNTSVSVFRNVAGVVTATSNTSTNKPSIKMFPNPGSSILILDSLRIADKWILLEITDVYGKKVVTNSAIRNSTRVDLGIEKLNSGTYFIILTNKEGKRAVLTFIKG